MYQKTITYTDYNGNERTEDHYFHLNDAEIIKWVTTEGDYTLDKLIVRLSKEQNGKKIVEIFDELLLSAYGKKSLDGRTFDKNDQIREEFKNSLAYSIIFSEIVSDSEKAAEFINGIIPANLNEQIDKILKENPEGIPAEIKDYLPKIEQKS